MPTVLPGGRMPPSTPGKMPDTTPGMSAAMYLLATTAGCILDGFSLSMVAHPVINVERLIILRCLLCLVSGLTMLARADEAPANSPRYEPERFGLVTAREFSDLERKAALGDAAAEYEAGSRYALGAGVETNLARAYDWLKKSASQGNVRAERRAGEMLLQGLGTATNLAAALEWLNQAAAQGDASAQFDLGIVYLNGRSTARDEAKAFQWFLAAARQGVLGAEMVVGSMYMDGHGTAQDFPAARAWLEQAAASQSPPALFTLGIIYFQGVGIPKDSRLAVSYFLRAALRGNLAAQGYLGIAFITGNGVAKDIPFGTRLLRKAAESGNASAEFAYGNLLLAPEDAKPDWERGYLWIQKAAAQGFAPAESKVGILYQQGQGTAPDEVESLKWFYLADDQGNEEAHERKDELLVFLDPPQAREARRRADTFRPQEEFPATAVDPRVYASPITREFQIDVSIYGKTRRLLVDSGSFALFLDEKFRSRLGEPLAQDTIINIFAADLDTSVFRCPDLYLGGNQLEEDWAQLFNFTTVSRDTEGHLDGILGMSVLKKHVVCFDWRKKRFILCGSVPEAIKQNSQAIPLKKFAEGANSYAIDANINGVGVIRLLIDTGFQGAATLSEEDWEQTFAQGNEKFSARIISGVGQQVERTKSGMLQTIDIGPEHFTNLKVEMVPGAHTHSSLGQEFIRKYVPAIDFPNQVLYLRKSD